MTQILDNTYGPEALGEGTSTNYVCPLQMLLCNTIFITPTVFHTLLPHEIKLPCVNTASMKDITKQIEIICGKTLIVNNNLSK